MSSFPSEGPETPGEPSTTDSDLPWEQAIIQVLAGAEKPLHYADIAKAIIDNGLRSKVGATPAATVAAILSTSLKAGKETSPFLRTERGYYSMRSTGEPLAALPEQDEATEDAEEMGLINAFGMFWRRDSVNWAPTQPLLHGVQQAGSEQVDFGRQIGVYLLHDRNSVVYVGRVTEPRLSSRLREHTRDRLSGRWDRFSWFGVQRVASDGSLSAVPQDFTLDHLVATMEALLIEGLEPAQNRRQGDGFNAVEFTQGVDPELEKKPRRELVAELTKILDL